MARLPSVLPPSATMIARLIRSASASSWSITPRRCSSSLRQGMMTRTDAVDPLNVAWCCLAMPLRVGAGEDMVCRWLVILYITTGDGNVFRTEHEVNGEAAFHLAPSG